MASNIKGEGSDKPGKKARGKAAGQKKSSDKGRAKKSAPIAKPTEDAALLEPQASDSRVSQSITEQPAQQEAQSQEDHGPCEPGAAQGASAAGEAEDLDSQPPVLFMQSEAEPMQEELEGGQGQQRESAPEEFIIFEVDGAPYAIRAMEVDEVLRLQPVTAVPGAGRHVLGITSLRGLIIPVLDFTAMLSGTRSAEALGDKAKILVIKNGDSPVGMRVQRKLNMLNAPGSHMLEPPAHISAQAARFLEGIMQVEGKFVCVINTKEILSINAGGRVNEKP